MTDFTYEIGERGFACSYALGTRDSVKENMKIMDFHLYFFFQNFWTAGVILCGLGKCNKTGELYEF